MRSGWPLVCVVALAATSIASVASAQVSASVEAVGHDESDGSDVGWNSQYPSPSFDDEPTRRGLPNAVWDGSHRLESGRICLTVSNLRSPYPPANTLSLGYRVRLSGAVFDDGTSERVITFARDLAAQSGCLPTGEIEALRQRMASAPSSRPLFDAILALRQRYGAIVQQQCACGGGGGQAAHGVWGVGVQMGYAEYGSGRDASTATLTQSFDYALQLGAASQCLPLTEIQDLRGRMASAPRSRPLYDAVLAMRLRYGAIVQQACACGPVSATPPATPPAAPTDPLAASSWRGVVRAECVSYADEPPDVATITIETRRRSATQVEVYMPSTLERTTVTTTPGGDSGSGHDFDGAYEREVTIAVRDGQLHYSEDATSAELERRCRTTGVLQPLR